MRSGTKIRLTSPITFSLCLAFAMTASPAAQAQEKLVAPAYPGALRVSPAKLEKTDGVVFLVKDAHDKAQAFYVPTHARLPKEDEGRTRGDTEIPLTVQSADEVTRIITSMKGDYTWARATEIIVKWNPELLAPMGPASHFLDELKGQAKRHPGHDAELAALREKYAWFNLAFVHPEKKLGEITQRCSAEASGMDPNVDQTAIANQMAQLAKEGRYQEIAELQTKMMGGDPKASQKKSKEDHFGLWKRCLEEAAGYGYLTRLTIDRDPHQWDVKWK